MQKVNLVCVGKLKEKFFADAVAEYVKRLGAFCAFRIAELPEKRTLAALRARFEQHGKTK